MENATSRILQSKYFNPAFNTAIFDGPLRVYFSQAFEPDAFKVYFSLQSHFFKEEALSEIRNHIPQDSTLFIMIYPCKETFTQSFDCDQDIAFQNLEGDMIIGVHSPVTDHLKDKILESIQTHVFKK